MQTDQKVTKIGTSLWVLVPKLYQEHMGVKEGDMITMQDEEGKKGKYITMWKKR